MITQAIYNILNSSILACQACRGAYLDEGKDAAGWAILFMLCIIVPMITAVGIFIYRIAQRQKKFHDTEFDDPFVAKNKI